MAAQNFPKFPKILKVFQFATGILWIVVKKIASLMFVSFFYLLMIFLVSFHFYCVSLHFISIVSRFVLFLLCLASFHFYCVSLRFISIVSRFVSFCFCSILFHFCCVSFRFSFYNHPIWYDIFTILFRKHLKKNDCTIKIMWLFKK